MSSGKGLPQFPDVEAKLQKPTKQSAFEKQRAEAAAKRKREAAENEAALKEFAESFDNDDGGGGGGRASVFDAPGRPRGGGGFGGAPPGVARRHFGQGSMKSGPGSLGPAPGGFKSGPGSLGPIPGGFKSGPGSLGPPPPAPGGFGKKRSFQDFARGGGARDRDDNRQREEKSGGVGKAFGGSDDEDMSDVKDEEEERAVAKPTLRLLNLPLGTSPAGVKALIPEGMVVDDVRILSTRDVSSQERKAVVAIVTLSAETGASDIDAAVSALQHRYLGFGHYLSLHRHLSSTALSLATAANPTSSANDAHPFGAKPVEVESNSQRSPQHSTFYRGGFAPPTSYNTPLSGAPNRSSLYHVPVKPPRDIRMVQSINKVIEGVLAHGLEFEALLMSRPEVQREEKWAWLWDARSEGGIWLRWRLWEVVTGGQSGKAKGKYVPIFDGSHAWKMPDKRLPFEYTMKLDEFVSDSEYNSSDDDDFDEEEDVRRREGQGGAEDEKTFLNPLEKAKLTHLLARLPTAISRLRKGDIARVTTFAIMHASRGADEVVDIIVQNVQRPLSLTYANPDRKAQQEKDAQDGGNDNDGAASLVGLYVVNDILSSSSTSGVRHAWRFRQLFETAIRQSRLFETVGQMPERYGWGRLRADKWKRSIGLVLNLWEGWSVFPVDAQEMFVKGFENPPSLRAEEKVAVDSEGDDRKGKWKSVEDGLQRAALPVSTAVEEDVEGEAMDEDDVEGEPIEDDDVEGEPIEDDDVEGEPIEDDDIEGEPIDEEDVEGEPIGDDDLRGEDATAAAAPEPVISDDKSVGSAGRVQPRKRMTAADMFGGE